MGIVVSDCILKIFPEKKHIEHNHIGDEYRTSEYIFSVIAGFRNQPGGVRHPLRQQQFWT